MNVSETLARLERLGSDAPTTSRIMRSCLRMLDRYGYADTLDTIHADGKDRWEVWALDSVAFACECLEARDPIGALRGYGQAKEYMGRHGGFFPCYLADAIRGLQDELERAIVRGGPINVGSCL